MQKKRVLERHRSRKHNLQHTFFMNKTAKNGRFWSKIEFFGLRQAFEDPPTPISRVLDAKGQVLGRHRSRKHNLQHVYAPKFAFFHEKNGRKWLFFGQRLIFFLAPDKQLKTPPPILRVLDANKQIVGAHRSQKRNLQHAYAPKFAIFHSKNGKNGRFFVENCVFWPQQTS